MEEELTISSIKIKNVEFSIEEAIDFFEIDLNKLYIFSWNNVPGMKYLFNWDEIPENDTMKLIEFLMQTFDIDWVKTAKIEKIDNGMTIRLTDGYLFCWEEIPGNDSRRLKSFLKQKFNIDWVKTAEINKIDNNTIRVYNKQKSILLKLNDENTKLNIEKDKKYLFSWEEISRNDNYRLKEFVMSNYDLNWVKTAEISKTNDGKNLNLTDGKNFISLNLNDENTELNLKIDNFKTDIFIVITENGNRNVYKLITDEFIAKTENDLINIYTVENNYLSLKLNNEQTNVKLEINDGRTDKFIAKRENVKLNIYGHSNESQKLTKYLNDEHGINWALSAEIKKDNEKSISIFKDDMRVEIKIDDHKKVSIKFMDGKNYELYTKTERELTNIYDFNKYSNQLRSDYPNQIISFEFKKSIKLELQNDDYIELIKSACYEIGFEGPIIFPKKFFYNRKDSPTSYTCSYTCGLKVNEEFKQMNEKIANDFRELILLKTFPVATKYGKISYTDISKKEMHDTPKKLNLHIITKLLGKSKNITYICFSDLIYHKLKEIFDQEESESLPQIDISQYINKLNEIVNEDIFVDICPRQNSGIIIQALENMRTTGNYKVVADLWNLIEPILAKIADEFGHENLTLSNYLKVLTLDNSYRRLRLETKCLIMAVQRNSQAHGKLVCSQSDQIYCALLAMKAIRDIYFDWCFFMSLNKCFSKLESKLKLSIEELWGNYYNGFKYYNGFYHGKKIVNNIIFAKYPENRGSKNKIEIIFKNNINTINSTEETFIFEIDLNKKSTILTEESILK